MMARNLHCFSHSLTSLSPIHETSPPLLLFWILQLLLFSLLHLFLLDLLLFLILLHHLILLSGSKRAPAQELGPSSSRSFDRRTFAFARSLRFWRHRFRPSGLSRRRTTTTATATAASITTSTTTAASASGVSDFHRGVSYIAGSGSGGGGGGQPPLPHAPHDRLLRRCRWRRRRWWWRRRCGGAQSQSRQRHRRR